MLRPSKEPLMSVSLWQEVIARKPFTYTHYVFGVKIHVQPGTRGRVIGLTSFSLAVQFEGHLIPLKIDNIPGLIPLTLSAIEH